jgi:hypothetical protein
MSQKVVLSFVVVSSIFLPFFSEYTGFSTPLLFSILALISVWSQEIFVIQIHFRSENVDFTRRFHSKFPNFPESMIRFTHISLASFLSGLILLRLGYIPNTEGMIILALLLLTMIRLFDPILGILAQPVSASYSSIIGYFVVLTFAISTAVNPDKLDIYHLPINISQGILFALVSYTVLNLRMAYYEKFCFMYEQTLESQLKLILIPLFFLSLHQVMSLLNAADLAIIFPR